MSIVTSVLESMNMSADKLLLHMVSLLLPIQSCQKPKPHVDMYQVLSLAHAQFNGLPTSAPVVRKLERHPGPIAESCTCFKTHSSCVLSATLQAHARQNQALPMQHVPCRVSTIAIMAEANERAKDRAPRSRSC